MSTRSKLVKARRPGLVVEFSLDGEPCKVELRRPNMGAKNDIFRRAGMSGEQDKDHSRAAALAAEILITCAYEPGSAERVFTRHDREMLETAGEEIDPLVAAAFQIVTPPSPEESAKNSEATPSAG